MESSNGVLRKAPSMGQEFYNQPGRCSNVKSKTFHDGAGSENICHHTLLKVWQTHPYSKAPEDQG